MARPCDLVGFPVAPQKGTEMERIELDATTGLLHELRRVERRVAALEGA